MRLIDLKGGPDCMTRGLYCGYNYFLDDVKPANAVACIIAHVDEFSKEDIKLIRNYEDGDTIEIVQGYKFPVGIIRKTLRNILTHMDRSLDLEEYYQKVNEIINGGTNG